MSGKARGPQRHRVSKNTMMLTNYKLIIESYGRRYTAFIPATSADQASLVALTLNPHWKIIKIE